MDGRFRSKYSIIGAVSGEDLQIPTSVSMHDFIAQPASSNPVTRQCSNYPLQPHLFHLQS